jgi:hypothetical protein
MSYTDRVVGSVTFTLARLLPVQSPARPPVTEGERNRRSEKAVEEIDGHLIRALRIDQQDAANPTAGRLGALDDDGHKPVFNAHRPTD